MKTATKILTLLSGGQRTLAMSAVTTASPQTVTLQRITPTGVDVTV